ncbi:MAG: Gfo/Idh/MocA family oxidoreductase, partial [Syntrophobacteraceae bacterium]
MLKVAIVGCGLVADQHLTQIRRVPDATIVAVCDSEPLMARQLSDRFKVPGCFYDVKEMLKSARPHIVHITTPAKSHYPLGKICLEAGCHVYIEKPFTVTAVQTEEILSIAEAR